MQLRLVAGERGDSAGESAGEAAVLPAATTPVERVFAHWVFMMGRQPRRTVLGPGRRKVIERALGWGYDEATLMLAIDGCASSAWHAGENDRGTPFDDLDLILRDERHIEQFCQAGERLHERAERALRQQQVRAAEPSAGPSAEVAERLRVARRDLAAQAARRTVR